MGFQNASEDFENKYNSGRIANIPGYQIIRNHLNHLRVKFEILRRDISNNGLNEFNIIG